MAKIEGVDRTGVIRQYIPGDFKPGDIIEEKSGWFGKKKLYIVLQAAYNRLIVNKVTENMVSIDGERLENGKFRRITPSEFLEDVKEL